MAGAPVRLSISAKRECVARGDADAARARHTVLREAWPD
jgi:hypothetical protein